MSGLGRVRRVTRKRLPRRRAGARDATPRVEDLETGD